MKNRKKWKSRISSWASRVLLAGLGVAWTGQGGRAQEERPIPKSYLNKGTVHLPIQIDDRVRPLLQWVQLYVKDGPQAPWEMKEKVPATQTFFTFRTTHDGEYWFNVVTVDRSGKAIPADVTKEPPGLIVVIDSTPPQVDVQVLATSAEGQQVRCEVRDANPDPVKTRMYYQTRDQIWRPLDAVSGQPDTFCIPGQAATTGMVRVTATDLARNTVNREFNLGTMPVANNNPFAGPKALPANMPAENLGQNIVVPPAPPDLVTTAKAPPTTVISEKVIPVSERIELVANKVSPAAQPQGPALEPTPKTAISEVSSKVPFAVPSSGETRASEPAPPLVKQADAPGKRHLVNSTHVFLDYQIDQTGASGVGRVEIWHTHDMGQTWHKLCEDPHRKGQAEIDLPGEGVYGLTVIVANGRGFGAVPPKTGDAPDWWVEVDTTKPQAELHNVRGNPNGDDGTLHITWTAKDKNIHPEPIDLFYATKREGPWLPIVKGIKNDGLYRWSPSAGVGTHAFVRLTVHDLAGNSTSLESAQPVALDDMSRPRGRLTGVTTVPRTALGNGPASMAPSGN
jgi:hypothetical protein